MLSQFTQNPIYAKKVQLIMDKNKSPLFDCYAMKQAQAITDLLDSMGYEHGIHIRGLYPTTLDVDKGRFKDGVSTFGAMGDSAFEASNCIRGKTWLTSENSIFSSNIS